MSNPETLQFEDDPVNSFTFNVWDANDTCGEQYPWDIENTSHPGSWATLWLLQKMMTELERDFLQNPGKIWRQLAHVVIGFERYLGKYFSKRVREDTKAFFTGQSPINDHQEIMMSNSFVDTQQPSAP